MSTTMMGKKLFTQRPLLTLPQILVLLGVVAALIIALDLNRRAQAGRTVGAGEAGLQAELNAEMTRQVELQARLSYVESDDYVEAYARDEGGYLKSNESRIVILPIAAPPFPTPMPTATPDPAAAAQPWQAWWQLLTDAPLPHH